MASKETIADYPYLLREYSERNELPPEKVTASTRKKIWWRCKISECGYEWKASGFERVRGAGCPACAGRRKKEK